MALCGIVWTCLLSLDKTNWHKTNGNAEYHALDLVLTYGIDSEQLTVFPQNPFLSYLFSLHYLTIKLLRRILHIGVYQRML